MLHGQNIPFENRYPREQWEARSPTSGLRGSLQSPYPALPCRASCERPLRGYIVARASGKSPIAHLKGAVSLTHLQSHPPQHQTFGSPKALNQGI